MCGRAYSTYTEEELEARYLNKKPIHWPGLRPNYNMAPSQDCLILRIQDGEKEFNTFRWGLIPPWSKDLAIGYKMINARAETIDEKPAFRKSFKKRRCIVPLSGFYEWKRTGDGKQPFAIFLKDRSILSVAGIWENWKSKEGQEISSFSIITTAANDFVGKIHDRMPVILDPKIEDQWLDPENEDVGKLKNILRPCPASWLEAYPVSVLVNSPKNNIPEVLKPANEGTMG